MKTRILRWTWILTLLGALLACSFVNNISQGGREAIGTAQSVATDAKQLNNLAATGQAFVTQAEGSGLVQTAQALATQADQSGLQETARAVATQAEQSGLGETAQALVTEAPGFVETFQAAFTSQAPELQGTLQALAAQLASALGEAPADIPVVQADRENYKAGSNYVTYTTSLAYRDVVVFYKTQMANLGWTSVEEGNVESSQTTLLHFEKPDRKASVTLTANPSTGKTDVTIMVEPK